VKEKKAAYFVLWREKKKRAVPTFVAELLLGYNCSCREKGGKEEEKGRPVLPSSLDEEKEGGKSRKRYR